MIKPFLFLLLLFSTLYSSAQNKGIIKGHIIDSISKQALMDAAVAILSPYDSTVVKYTFAGKDASFIITDLPFSSYLVRISFLGYSPLLKTVLLNNFSPIIDLGNVVLIPQVKYLDNIIVRASPIQIKGDTIEFNAEGFKTTPYAMLEELLERLPGVQIGMDGSIKINGETLEQLLVDGKPFFGGDPIIALKNLPADIIDKVQVYKSQSEQSAFSSFDNGNKKKIVNVIIKQNRRKGDFGKVLAGAGTQGVYNAELNMNHFNDQQQISLIGQSNNTGSTGFTDLSPVNSTGITQLYSGGINYRDKWGNATDISGSYFFNRRNTESDQQTFIQSILSKDSSTFNKQISTGISLNSAHRINFNVETKIDSLNAISIRSNINFQDIKAVTSQQSLLLNSNKADDTIYTSGYKSDRITNSHSATVDALFKHRFRTPSQTWSLDLNLSQNLSNSNGTNNTQTSYILPEQYSYTLDQHFTTIMKNLVLNSTANYTQPINNYQTLELIVKFNTRQATFSNQTNNLNGLTHKYDLLDTLQSIAFKNTYNTNAYLLNYRFKTTRYSLILGLGTQTDYIAGHTYTSLLPFTSLNYIITPDKSLQFNYNVTPNQLSIQQIQPITTTVDSLFIQKGNPALRQSITHTASLSYNSLRPADQQMLLISFNGSITYHDIQNAITLLDNGAQVMMPINAGKTYSFSTNLNYSFPLNKSGTTISFVTGINYLQTPDLINNRMNVTKNWIFNETVSLTSRIAENLDLIFNTTSGYNIINYTLQPNSNTTYFVETLLGKVRYRLQNWTASAELYYTYNSSPLYNNKKGFALLSPALSRQVLKNKAGEIRLSAYDLLNQRINISRSISGNTIQEFRSSTRGRYIILSFLYNFRKFRHP